MADAKRIYANTFAGTLIRRIRETTDLKAQDVSERIQKSTAYVSKLERGEIGSFGMDEIKAMFSEMDQPSEFVDFFRGLIAYQENTINEPLRDFRYEMRKYVNFQALAGCCHVYHHVAQLMPSVAGLEAMTSDIGVGALADETLAAYGPKLVLNNETVILSGGKPFLSQRSFRNIQLYVDTIMDATGSGSQKGKGRTNREYRIPMDLKTTKLIFKKWGANISDSDFSLYTYKQKPLFILTRQFGGNDIITSDSLLNESLDLFLKLDSENGEGKESLREVQIAVKRREVSPIIKFLAPFFKPLAAK